MFRKTASRLRCPAFSEEGLCASALQLRSEKEIGSDIRSGLLICETCGERYPILEGVAVLVADVGGYLHAHAKGIRHWVPESRIPSEFREVIRAGLEEALEIHGEEHQEEDLEAERVTSLYVMTHFLYGASSKNAWWKPDGADAPAQAFDPVFDELVRNYWERGPFARISELLAAELGDSRRSLIELGCGVGGLALALESRLSSYLGIDSSFASIALARHLVLGVPIDGQVRIPGDLLDGPVSRPLPSGRQHGGHLLGEGADFIVSDAVAPAVETGSWDLCASLNMIDMLDEPESLPRVQHELLHVGGIAVQSCPYIWHPRIARELRERLGLEGRSDSAAAVERIYRDQGFDVITGVSHVPWLFFKHLRQMEIYSVHLFLARKAG